MKIIGNRIFLRPFEKKEARFLQEIRQDFMGLKSFAASPFPSNLESEEEWISHMYPPGLRSSIILAAFESESSQFLGYCNARNINYLNRNAEVGIILHTDARGKGFFKDISLTFHNYLFKEINLNKVYSFVITTNTIAIESYKKLGFLVEGHIKEQIYQDGQYKDVFFISLYLTDFHNVYKAFYNSKE
jgi:RimJ/RimL family protein N-acetyltransferase